MFRSSLFRFYVVGGSTTLLQLVLLFLLTDMLGIWYLLSAVIALLLSFMGNFYFNRVWTFSSGVRGKKGVTLQWCRFLVTGTTAMVLQVAVLYALSEFIMLWYMLSAAIAVVLVSLLNYLMNRNWVFRS